MSRIATTFAHLAQRNEAALMPYLMTGYPARDSAVELAIALEAAGADMFELGVPFSDPLADGPTVQRAAEQALANGVTLPFSLATVAAMRARGVQAPLVMMGYTNPFMQYGFARLCAELSAAGGDGLIIPDLPPEESAEVQAACRAHSLDLICIVAPTTTDERIAEIAQIASGFIYCVALTGVTGARRELWDGLPDFLQRVRRQTTLPLAVGFGISNARHVAQVVAHADGAIVGAALINTLAALPPETCVAGAAAFTRALKGGTRRVTLTRD